MTKYIYKDIIQVITNVYLKNRPMNTFKTICMDCKKVIKTVPAKKNEVSHGICKICMNKRIKKENL